MSGQKNSTMDADAPVADNQNCQTASLCRLLGIMGLAVVREVRAFQPRTQFRARNRHQVLAADEALAIAKDVTRYTNAKLAATDYPGPSGTQMIATSSPVEAHGSGVCARMNSRSGAAELRASPTGPVLRISAADQSDWPLEKNRTRLSRRAIRCRLHRLACAGRLR